MRLTSKLLTAAPKRKPFSIYLPDNDPAQCKKEIARAVKVLGGKPLGGDQFQVASSTVFLAANSPSLREDFEDLGIVSGYSVKETQLSINFDIFDWRGIADEVQEKLAEMQTQGKFVISGDPANGFAWAGPRAMTPEELELVDEDPNEVPEGFTTLALFDDDCAKSTFMAILEDLLGYPFVMEVDNSDDQIYIAYSESPFTEKQAIDELNSAMLAGVEEAEADGMVPPPAVKVLSFTPVS
jgi:hypothetical protein